MSLDRWISHTENIKAMVLGINAIEAILERNHHFRQLSGLMDVINELHRAREAIQARDRAAFPDFTPKQPQQQWTESIAMQQR